MDVRSNLSMAAVAVAASLVFASSASAQQGPITIQGVAPPNIQIERVPYWDLNLATRYGERALQWRVSHAVDRVCLRDVGGRDYINQDYNQCTWGAWRGAQPQMNAAVYRARQLAYFGGY